MTCCAVGAERSCETNTRETLFDDFRRHGVHTTNEQDLHSVSCRFADVSASPMYSARLRGPYALLLLAR